MEEIVVVRAKRSAISKIGGAFKKLNAIDLLDEVGKHLLEDFPKELIDNVIIGNVIQAGNGQNIARQFALKQNLSFETMATTVNAVCGSGMQSIIFAIQSLRLFESNVCVVGGVESMSNAPFLLKNHRFGRSYGQDILQDSIQVDGLYDNVANIDMIETAENIAIKYNISKEEQDAFALASHLKASNASKLGYFKDEIVEINGVDEDAFIRHDASFESISKVKALRNSVSAANASGLSDGAALLVLMRRSDCERLKLKPLATIKDYATSGCDNQYMGLSPIFAIQKILNKTKTTLNDYDLFEMTEAFAAQSIAVAKELGVDENKFNVNGGAIAIGHPLGASGARLVISTIYELIRSKKHNALATLCIGGGNSIAVAIERFEEK